MRKSLLNRSTKSIKRGKRMRGVRIDPADKYFSLWIRWRAGWTCQRCGVKYEPGTASIHCSHFWGRAREATRFDPENAVAHCHGCHAFLTANPELHREWKLAQLGAEKYSLLLVRAQLPTKKDRKMAALYWREKLKQDYPQALN